MSKQKQRSKRLTAVEELTVEKASVKAVREAVGQQGGAGAVLTRASGNKIVKSEVSAPPALSSAQALGKIIAEKIVAHLDGGERGIFAEMMQLSKEERSCKVSALGEIITQRGNRIKDVTADYGDTEFATRKINSIRASFSRIIVVVEAMLDERNDYDFSECENFSDMVSVSRTFSTGKGKHTKTMTASGFKTWLDKSSRIVDLKGYDKASDTSIAQVARLEQFIVAAVSIYAAVGDKVTGLRFDIPALKAIIAPKVVVKKHLRRAA